MLVSVLVLLVSALVLVSVLVLLVSALVLVLVLVLVLELVMLTSVLVLVWRFLREVLSDLRSPGSVSHPADGAAVVRTCAGDRIVEIYDMFHTPGTCIPPKGFVSMT